jgi:hypothetical protein
VPRRNALPTTPLAFDAAEEAAESIEDFVVGQSAGSTFGWQKKHVEQHQAGSGIKSRVIYGVLQTANGLQLTKAGS